MDVVEKIAIQRYRGAIVIPVLNEAEQLRILLPQLQHLKAEWLLVVVDGGSRDETATIANKHAHYCLSSTKGRAPQQNAGARHLRPLLDASALLVFLHADTRLPEHFSQAMHSFQESSSGWGRFDLRLSGSQPCFRVIERLINWRSRLTGIATGDQALFFKLDFFFHLQGFPQQPLMEDIEICLRAKKQSRPFYSSAKVTTSSRKWEREGILRTIVLMWCCRAAYFFGVSAERIHDWYYK